MRVYSYLFCFLVLFSCDRPSVVEKDVNSVYKSIQRRWQFIAIDTTGPLADSARVELTAASVDWSKKCEYKDENGSYNFCGGQGSINGLEVVLSYGYDAAQGKFLLMLANRSTDLQDQRELGQKLERLLNGGKWEFSVVGDIFTAKQIANDSMPGVLTTLTAKAI